MYSQKGGTSRRRGGEIQIFFTHPEIGPQNNFYYTLEIKSQNN